MYRVISKRSGPRLLTKPDHGATITITSVCVNIAQTVVTAPAALATAFPVAVATTAVTFGPPASRGTADRARTHGEGAPTTK